MKIFPTILQKKILDGFIDTYRFVYNRTLEYVKHYGYDPNFQDLRNILVTENTRKNYSCKKYIDSYLNTITNKKYYDSEKLELEEEILNKLPLRRNPLIRDFELNTSKDIRSNAVKSVCDAYKSGISNLKAGNIKFFNISFKKKSEKRKCIELSSADIKKCKTGIKISPSRFPRNENIIKISKRNQRKYRDLQIRNNCDLIKEKGEYYIFIPVPYGIAAEKETNNICGIDPGVRTFLSIYSNNIECSNPVITSISEKYNLLDKLNNKIAFLKNTYKLVHKRIGKRLRKKQFNKIEKKKLDVINTMHWDAINYLTDNYDTIFFGDINSHSIVKNGKNKTLNRNISDLKYFVFKQRLKYKCIAKGVKIFFVNEAYTTQGCSECGSLNRSVGTNEIYNCINPVCGKVFGRDFNAAKNMFMKGYLQSL